MAFSKGFHKKYALLGKNLGQGAYSTVQMGRENLSGLSVAVKILSKDGLSEKEKKKLMAEVAILKKIRHLNVVRVYECFDEPKEFMLVMEHIDGGSLADLTKYKESEVIDYIYQTVIALQHCKNEGIVHRDLKPANILITSEGNVKLADFNLSKMVGKEATEFTVLETICGTPNFIAPEILLKKPYNYKCDVWSLGVVAFYLLTGGHFPFSPDSQDEEMLSSLFENVKKAQWSFKPENLWDLVSDQSKNFVLQCLQLNPERRFTYEQLVAHPWLKKKNAELGGYIDVSAVKEKNAKKKQLMSAAMASEAAHVFGALMAEKKEVVARSGSGIFDINLSGFS